MKEKRSIRRVNLDVDALRTFVAGVDLGSFAKAADRLGRSPSAISQQLRKLEGQFGSALVEKRGRGLVPTPAGEVALSHARRILALNDEALAAVQGIEATGAIRFGLVQDFGETVLPAVLGRFARSRPGVMLEAAVDSGQRLVSGVEDGRLDVALVWGEPRLPDRQWLGAAPMIWVGVREVSAAEPVPLVVLHSPCRFREAGCRALDEAGIPWRIVFTSPGLGATWAAVAAGLGVMPRVALGLPAGVRRLEGLNSAVPLPEVTAWLVGCGQGSEAGAALRHEVADRVEEVLG